MDHGQTPIPAGYRLRPAADLRRLANGRILMGGSPLSIVRLSEPGAAAVTGWFAGAPIGAASSHQQLARRLAANGMGLLEPLPRSDEPDGEDRPPAHPVTVIIPVKDDQPGLDATLAALQADAELPHPAPIDLSIVVVDDGSTTPVVTVSNTITVLRNDRPLGPGAARQRALDAIDADHVCFIDAGVEITTESLARLVQRLDDQAVLAVAPRIVSPPQDHPVGRYDVRRSPLDLGPGEGLVGVGKAVPYVPTACLLVRASAVDHVGGFDPDLRYGEDVDLVWRLTGAGDVLYLPDVEASHPPRQTIAAMVRQRMTYGSAAAPLAARHGDAVSPARLSGWSVLITALFAGGHPVPAIGAGAWTALALRPKIEPLPDVTIEASLLTAKGHWYGGLSILTAVARTWAPFALAALVLLPSQRRRMALLLASAAGRRLLDGPRHPAAASLDVALGAVDDLSYCAGVWQGVVSRRSAEALKPAIVSWPTPKARDSNS